MLGCFTAQRGSSFARHIPTDTKQPKVHISKTFCTVAPRCGLQIHDRQMRKMQLHKNILLRDTNARA